MSTQIDAMGLVSLGGVMIGGEFSLAVTSYHRVPVPYHTGYDESVGSHVA
jgi:hypothetical protein